MSGGELYLTAHHEAGHAVAALMRGGEVVSVTIKPTARRGGGCEIRPGSADAADFWAFNYYAGPWAEARAQWTQPTIDEDSFDDEGRCFADHVATAFVGSPQDSYKYQREVDGDLSAVVNAQFDAMNGQHFVAPRIAPLMGTWDAELEDRWPIIRTVARLLMDGCTDVDAITAAVWKDTDGDD